MKLFRSLLLPAVLGPRWLRISPLKVVLQPSRPKMGLPYLPLPTHVRNFSLTGNMGLGHGQCQRSWRRRWVVLPDRTDAAAQLAQWAATLVCTALALLVCQKWRGDTPTLGRHASWRTPMCPQVEPCATRNLPLSLRTSITTASTPGCLRCGGSSGIAQPVSVLFLSRCSRTKTG